MTHLRRPHARVLGAVRRRLRGESGFGLIELLIAMTVLNLGILAIFAGFSNSYSALNRATRTSSAAVLADAQLERFRALKFTAICLSNSTTDTTRTNAAPTGTAVGTCSTTDPAMVTTRSSVSGPEGWLYRIDTYVVWRCIVGTLTTSSPYTSSAPGCVTSSVEQASATKLVRVTIRDKVTIAKVYATQESVFDETTGL